MADSVPWNDVYAHNESGKLMFVLERTSFPSDFNQALWRLIVLGAMAPPHVARSLRSGPNNVTTTAAIEKI